MDFAVKTRPIAAYCPEISNIAIIRRSKLPIIAPAPSIVSSGSSDFSFIIFVFSCVNNDDNSLAWNLLKKILNTILMGLVIMIKTRAMTIKCLIGKSQWLGGKYVGSAW